MICKEVHKKMNAYLSQKLTPEQLEAFELHVKDCAYCRQIISEAQATMALIDHSAKLSADPFMFTRIQAEIENRMTEKNRSWKKALQPVMLTMVMLVGLFVGINLGSTYYNEAIQFNAEETLIDNQDGDLYFNVLAYESIESFLLTEN